MKRSREPDEDSPETASPAAPLSSSGTGSSIHSDEETAAALPPSKIVGLDPFATLNKNIEMRCSLPPHKEPLHFRSYEDYETHYRKAHSNRCIECRKNFPSAHLLSVHAEEMHDPFAQVLREKGERTVSSPHLGVLEPSLADEERVAVLMLRGGLRQEVLYPTKTKDAPH